LSTVLRPRQHSIDLQCETEMSLRFIL